MSSSTITKDQAGLKGALAGLNKLANKLKNLRKGWNWKAS